MSHSLNVVESICFNAVCDVVTRALRGYFSHLLPTCQLIGGFVSALTVSECACM